MLKYFLVLVLVCSAAYCSFIPTVKFGNVIRDLYPKNTDDMRIMANRWSVSGLIYDNLRVGYCAGLEFLVGPGLVERRGSFSRTYGGLPLHNTIYFDIRVQMIGDWAKNQGMFTLRIDEMFVRSFSVREIARSERSFKCSGTGWDIDTQLVGNVGHAASAVTLSFDWILSEDNVYGAFAIRDVSLSLDIQQNTQNKALLTLSETSIRAVSGSGSSEVGKTNCLSGFYRSGESCLQCDAACQDCFGPSSSECYQCAWTYNLIEGQCLQCTANCALCSGVSFDQCLLCSSGYTLDSNGTCNNSTVVAVCDSWWIYKYPNGSCLSGCPTPHIPIWRDGSAFCDPPCPTEYYLTATGSCTDTCEIGPLRVEGDIIYCDQTPKNGTNSTNSTTECDSIYEFKYPDGSCLPECEYAYIPSWRDGSYFCDAPCSTGYYFVGNDSCVDACEVRQSEVRDGILYCYQVPDTDSIPGCPNYWDWKYSNGSCLGNCPQPYMSSWSGGFSSCNPPCLGELFYSSFTDSCVYTCKPEFLRVEYDIIYCDEVPSPGNDTNSTTGCDSIYEFKYPNGSCLFECPSPYLADWRDGSYFCDAPCSTGYYYFVGNDSCVDTCKPEFLRVENDIIYCDEVPSPGNDTNSTTGCDSIYEFKYPNGSCLLECPSPYLADWRNGSYFCDAPCSTGYYYFVGNDSCVDTCKPEFLRVEYDILYCDEVPSPRMATSSAQVLNKKFENGAQTNKLDLEGVGVLDYRSSINIPNEGQVQVGESSSTSNTLAIALGAGLALIAAALVAYSIYRYKRKQKLMMVRAESKMKSCVLGINTNQPDKKTNDHQPKDEEMRTFTQNSIIQAREQGENDLSEIYDPINQPNRTALKIDQWSPELKVGGLEDRKEVAIQGEEEVNV